ncbi:MAG: ATP-binding protein [Clostridia bacterium]|nr:ATP-binding protein [Clostridia bacterium]
MLKRKIETTLKSWKETQGHKPLVIKGCRQCGKTCSVRQFAQKNYDHEIYLNFFENKSYASVFSGSLEVDHLTMLLSALLGPKAVFESGKTVLILDEIQDCPEARTALKFFAIDGRYDVIATGSLPGVKGYGKRPTSIPVGYEQIEEMYPLDFEEFLWANGIDEPVIQYLKGCLNNETPVAEALHQKLRQLLLQYTVVGGMPAPVQTFVDTHQMNTVLQLQRGILADYEEDMVKYADDRDKPYIRECFQSIPRQLGKKNKKFQYSVVQKGATSSKFTGSLQWIEDAGIIRRCYNLSLPELPLDGNAIQDIFKVYMVDSGMLVAMLEDGTQFDVLQGNLYGHKGAISENLAADILTKMGRKLYYYHKDSGLEIGFVMRYAGKSTLLEVKATTGNTKSAKTLLDHPETYHVGGAIRLGDYNVSRAGNILTLPFYMAFLLMAY